MPIHKIEIRYFASLRELAGKSHEILETSATNGRELYSELQKRYGFKLEEKHLKLSLNRRYVDFESKIQSGDELVFIPPVAGG